MDKHDISGQTFPLNDFATYIQPGATWKDLNVPETIRSQINDIVTQAKAFQTSFSDKGLNILFSGPSGTGKTLSARILAAELGMDLYRVDLAAVINKYIGETEKNLNAIFDAAKVSNAILYFDEADALFGKRTEINDTHDRFANMEVNYLLQRIESYAVVVILASNLKQDIDPALIRRMRYVVEFPTPVIEQRMSLWQRLWLRLKKFFNKI